VSVVMRVHAVGVPLTSADCLSYSREQHQLILPCSLICIVLAGVGEAIALSRIVYCQLWHAVDRWFQWCRFRV